MATFYLQDQPEKKSTKIPALNKQGEKFSSKIGILN